MSQSKPVFFTRVHRSRLKLFHLGQKSDTRYIRFTNGASDREAQFNVARAESGVYRITSVRTLAAGEYAFFATPRTDTAAAASPAGMLLALPTVCK